MKSLIYLLLLTSLMTAQTTQWFGFSVNLDLIKDRMDSLDININGIKAGSWRWEVESKQNKLTFTDISILDGRVREDAIVNIDRNILTKNSFSMQFQAGANMIESDLKWNQSHVSGRIETKLGGQQKVHNVDTVFKSIIPRMTLVAMLPYIDFSLVKGELNLQLYAMESHSVFPVKLSVHKSQIAITKMGSYEVTRIDIIKSGSQGVSNRFYITDKSPRHIVKVDVLGQQMEIDWVKRLK